MKSWRIEGTEQGGTIERTAPPFFSAQWTTGFDPDEITAIEGPCFTDEGSGEEDAIFIYGFQWSGAPPESSEFESLMGKAIAEIDSWIMSRL